MLVTMREILGTAALNGRAVGAFNVNNMEQVQAVIAAAEAEGLPAIIQTSEGALRYAGVKMLGTMVSCAAKSSKAMLSLHLDHGITPEIIEACIDFGWTSVMVDASAYCFEENVLRTKEVVDLAHKKGVSVEAELGRIVGTEDRICVNKDSERFTDPNAAGEFVKQTGADALAVAIGTAHGMYKDLPKLDFERLKAIKEQVGDTPLVLHGASGLAERDVRRAIELGVRKINIDTDLRQAFADGCKEVFAKKPDEINPRKICGLAREKVESVVRAKMRIFALK